MHLAYIDQKYISMKKGILLITIIGLLFSCSDRNEDLSAIETTLIGKWKLIEVLIDPGDGSGTYIGVSSEKIVEFHNDGTITSNGTICETNTLIVSPSSGTYSVTESTIDSDCPLGQIPGESINFSKQGSYLTISSPRCFETCSSKYVKIQE